MSYELEALARWVAAPSEGRRPPDLAFTAGPAREISDHVRTLELQLQEEMKVSRARKTMADNWAKEAEAAQLQVSEAQKKADGYLAVLGAIRAVLILDQGDKMSPELRKALWLDYDVAMDLQRVRREAVEAARELAHIFSDTNKVKPDEFKPSIKRLYSAIVALEKIEVARTEKGLPLETSIIEKRLPEPRKLEGCPVCGSKLVMIRGKVPKTPDREICPTCAQEKLEDLIQRQSPDYGRAYTEMDPDLNNQT